MVLFYFIFANLYFVLDFLNLMTASTINFDVLKMTDEQFFQLCQDNLDLRFERNASGEIIITTIKI